MTNLREDHNDEWKKELHTCLITSVINGENTDKSITERVGYHYMCNAPALLYRYCSDNSRTLENIKANKMWFSAPCNFNDVFDCDIRVDEKQVFQSALKLVPEARSIREGSYAWRSLKTIVAQELRKLKVELEKLKTNTGILCLSESEDSLLMWAHYANNHRGICIEYGLLDINEQLGFSPVPVIYSDDRVSFSTVNLDVIDAETTEVFIKSLIIKSPEWSYEHEWRIIRDEGACGFDWDAEHKGALLNMVCPRSITLGCMASKEFEDEVRAYCEDNKINLYKMEKNKDLYKLDKIPILQFD